MKLMLITIVLAALTIAALFSVFKTLPSKQREKQVEQPSSVVENQPIQALAFNGVTIPVEIRDTDPERQQGLSGRENLPSGSGLLFIFEQPGNWGFWMKDMNFSIDILWLDENFQVITSKEHVSPSSYPEVFYPKAFARYVLELEAGFSQAHNIIEGSQFSVIR